MDADGQPEFPQDFILVRGYAITIRLERMIVSTNKYRRFPSVIKKIKNKSDTRHIGCDIKLDKYFLTHDAAITWLKKNKKSVRVKSQWSYCREWVHKEDFPMFLPKNPHKFYVGRGWISWGHFLGTDNVCPWLIYKDQTAEDIQGKKDLLCSLIEVGEVEELKPVYDYLKNGDATGMYLYFNNHKQKIISIVVTMLRQKNFNSRAAMLIFDSCFSDAYFEIERILTTGRFRPHKLIKRKPLYSWMATFVYVVMRAEITNNGKYKVDINDITQKYHEELQEHQEDLEL